MIKGKYNNPSSYDLEKEITIYPNPATERANINISLKKPSAVCVKVIDPSGRVLSIENHDVNGQATIPVGLSNLSKGVYLLKMEAAGEVSVVRLIKN